MTNLPEPLKFVLHGSEWRWTHLADAVAEAFESVWHPAAFAKVGDHDHCDICFFRLASDDDPAISTGFRSGSRWLCNECHTHFIRSGDRCFICGGTLGDTGDKVEGCTLHPQRKYRWYHHACYDHACGVGV